MRVLRRHPVHGPTVELPIIKRCRACGHADQGELEPVGDDHQCTDPTLCRRRAQHADDWCAYTPEVSR
jgi:hypothetical protein